MGVGLHKADSPAGETGVSTPSAKPNNKKKGRSIVYSPTGWYDNAPTLLRRGFAALKAAGALPPHPHKLFEKSLTKNF